MEEEQIKIEPLTDDYILSRFNDLSIQILHLKTQFDHLLQSFTIYTNLEGKLETNNNTLKTIETSLSSNYNSINEMTNKIVELEQRIDLLQVEVMKNRPIDVVE